RSGCSGSPPTSASSTSTAGSCRGRPRPGSRRPPARASQASSSGGVTMHYVVTEGRARMLDRLSLMDRSTYGVDWMVMNATSARDRAGQGNLFKAGTHPAQGRLELEAARHRTSTPGYTPAWEAESQIISSDIAETLDSVEDRQRELAALRGELSQ